MRRALLAASLLLGVSFARAGEPLQVFAPEFPEESVWLNSEPVTIGSLAKQNVALVAFINPYSLHSIRSFRQLKRWKKLFGYDGLLVVGIHASDFDFDNDALQVRAAVKRHRLDFPVVIDSGHRLWREYQNSGWPSYYVVDQDGRILHEQLGEGGYERTEGEILKAMKALNGYVPPASYKPIQEPSRLGCGASTPALYLGGRRGKPVGDLKKSAVSAILASRDGEISKAGKWQSEAETLNFAGADNKDLSAQLAVIYQGAEAAVVAARGGKEPVQLYLKQDNLWLQAANAGPDVRFDDKKRSYILIDSPRLYYATKNPSGGVHDLRLIPSRAVKIYDLEFSDLCQTDYDHT